MTFDVLVLSDLFKNLPPTFKDNIEAAIKELNDPFPGTGKGEKKEIRGANDVAYRLREENFASSIESIRKNAPFTYLTFLPQNSHIKNMVGCNFNSIYLYNYCKINT